MKICMLSKFPPVEGGIAARTYWLAKGLAEAGHEITILTNSACVESEYRIPGCDDHIKILKNIRVINIGEEIPWHIPNSKLYETRLLNETLKLLNNEHFDLIDSGFLVTYGIVAYLAHKITSIPYMVRHGGSDIAKFLNHPEFNMIVEETIRNANAIITDDEHNGLFSLLNPNTVIFPPYIPDENVFSPAAKKSAIPTFAYVGKINFHWCRKGLDKIVEIFDGIDPEKYLLLFVAQGLGLDDFKKTLSNKMSSKIVFKSFVPPWEMPKLLNSIDFLFHLEVDEPIKNHSNLVCEAQASGVEIITNKEDGVGKDIPAININDFDSYVHCVNNLIQSYRESSRSNTTTNQSFKMNYKQYIDANYLAYKRIADNKTLRS